MTRYVTNRPGLTPDPQDGDPFIEWEGEGNKHITVHVDDDLTFTGLYNDRGRPIYRTDKIQAGFRRNRS